MPNLRYFTLRRLPLIRHVWRHGLLIAVATGIVAAASAQEYRADPSDNAAKQNLGAAMASVKNPGRYATDKAKVQEYFAKHYFPEMTGFEPDNLKALGDARFNLFKRYLWATSNADYQKDLTKTAFDSSLKIAANLTQLKPAVVADPPYHPAVRYNAVLILGMLDEQYAIDGAGGRPPKPLPAATKALTAIVDRATTGNQFPPPVILGALIGLERHAKYRDALAPGDAEKMSAALLKLVQHEKPIQEMDSETYAWLQLRAASALTLLGSLGKDNAIHDAFIKLIGGFKSLDDRTTMAGLLGQFKYEGAKIDAAAATEQLFKLARDVGAEE
jgi:hypothetical protein